MIQDIFPSRLDNSFRKCDICENDDFLCFDSEGRILVDTHSGKIVFPKNDNNAVNKKVYAFSVDDKRYFIALGETSSTDPSYEYLTIRQLRDKFSGKELFAAFTAYHLWKWYSDNRFCGKCGAELGLHESERAMKCEKCGNTVYPRINPAVIVGVIKDDSILITRYRRGFAHNALVAGFTEIGETLEETVRREVMEETGVKVKNIRYYKSQPWGMAQDILVGFYCDADGDGGIHMDENELKYAEWVKREDIELQPYSHSLTNEMMKIFKEGKI
ncbi:MAG: NAD(+) diphosphatase [Ruminococcus sp.]|uniref:NAD(+) diphosphatase n=1 Tax=Ruminococcus sp. TaxID=41978 RepID=UPI0025D70750|nr:NAD(+) diphosphatase [Ruminococcus sp.]MCR4796147.1 NAD(+) diphosphatase [Ruminococcus sp.]